MIQVIHRAVDILELLSENIDKELGLRDIAEPLKLNHGTCANIIKTLINRGYIEKRGGYTLGAKSYYLSHNFSNKSNVVAASKLHLKQLQETINESCILAFIKDNIRVTLHKETSKHELQANTRDEKHAYMTATGRILIACMDQNSRSQFIEKYGLPGEMWPEATDESEFARILDDSAAQRIAEHYADSDIVGVAVPLFQNGKAQASIGTYLPVNRFTPEKRAVIIAALKETAEKINGTLSRQ